MTHSTYETSEYATTGEMPYRIHVETYSLLEVLGNPAGRSVLDAACGDGYYARLLRGRGASRVVGFDLSSSMIRAAREAEARSPLGIEYYELDVFSAPVLGAFDLVVAGWLFPYGTSPAELTAIARRMRAQLGPGGRIAGVIPAPSMAATGDNYTKYGMTYSAPEHPGDGDEYTLTFHLERPFSIRSRIWTPETLGASLVDGGFQHVRWSPPRCSPEGIARYGADYWELALSKPNMLFFSAEA